MMATIKSYTDINQSKKLAEILPLESADMYYALSEDESMNMISFGKPQGFFDKTQVVWSLAALLGVIKEQGLVDLRFLQSTYDNRGNHLTNVWCCTFEILGTVSLDLYANNPIDACVTMIEKIHELKML
jgi:hypothetical protein